MPNAVVSATPYSITSDDQGISVSQGIGVRQSSNSIGNNGNVSPTIAYKMRAWDTVANQYIYWQSYGDEKTPPPTQNPVTGITATRVSVMRTV